MKSCCKTYIVVIGPPSKVLGTERHLLMDSHDSEGGCHGDDVTIVIR